jgi:hypothetical protein
MNDSGHSFNTPIHSLLHHHVQSQVKVWRFRISLRSINAKREYIHQNALLCSAHGHGSVTQTQRPTDSGLIMGAAATYPTKEMMKTVMKARKRMM